MLLDFSPSTFSTEAEFKVLIRSSLIKSIYSRVLFSSDILNPCTKSDRYVSHFFLWNAGHSCRLIPKSVLRSKAKAKSLKFNIKKIIFQIYSYKNNYPIDSDGERLNLKWIEP